MKKHFSSENFENIYIEILKEINENYEFKGSARGVSFKEITNINFELTNIKNNLVSLKSRNFNLEFGNKFFDWMISGQTDISQLTGVNPNAKNFMANGELPDNFNTAYGPRLIRQIPSLIKLLNHDKESRRGFIHILEENDNLLWTIESKLEYPCTIGVQYLIRNNKLNSYVLMRSNNMVLTVCYDVYNFTKLQSYIAKLLNIEVGIYYQSIVSAHYFEKEQPLVDNILEEYSLNLSEA